MINRLGMGHVRWMKPVAFVLAVILAMPPLVAHAEETSSQVRAQAAEQNERLDELLAQMEEARDELEGLEKQLDKLAKESVKIQGTLIEDRDDLSDMVDTTYRWGTPSVWEIALSSKDIEDFISNLYYAEKVTQWQASCVENLKADKIKLEERMDKIEQKRTERQHVLDQMEESSEELQATIDALLERAKTLEAKERAAEEARLAKIAREAEAKRKRQAEEQAKQEAAAKARAEAEAAAAAAASEEAESAATTEAQEDSQGEQYVEEQAEETQESQAEAGYDEESEWQEPEAEQQPEAEPEPEPEPEPEAETEAAGDWVTCAASAYTIADNTPPGSTATSSGIPLDESVPTVAMPASISPERFYGSSIQIEYGGVTVIAMVTDCGDLSGGARGLDITPAVFRAFGFSTADAWGVRTVRYRFL